MAESNLEATPVAVGGEPKITVLPPDTAKEAKDREFSHKVWQTHAKQAIDVTTEPYRLSGRRVSLGGKIPNRKPSP